MRKVFKYDIPVDDRPSVSLPKGAQILSVGVLPVGAQGLRIKLWALVNPAETDTEVRQLRVVGTGHAIVDGDLVFLGTVTFHDGALVFHVFEVCHA